MIRFLSYWAQEHCAGQLIDCKAQQMAFDQLIEGHLAELDKMKVS